LLTTFTTFKISCKTGRSARLTRQKSFEKFRKNSSENDSQWKNLEKPGISSPGGGRFNPYWLTTGPPAAAYGPETGTLVCLHRETRKARTGALTASQQNGI
jgi:hypothetical protein